MSCTACGTCLSIPKVFAAFAAEIGVGCVLDSRVPLAVEQDLSAIGAGHSPWPDERLATGAARAGFESVGQSHNQPSEWNRSEKRKHNHFQNIHSCHRSSSFRGKKQMLRYNLPFRPGGLIGAGDYLLTAVGF